MGEDNSVSERNGKLEWMYKGPNNEVDKEDYLLGKAVTNSTALLGIKNEVERDCLPVPLFSSSVSSNNVSLISEQVDVAKKLHEDPLLAIKKKEIERREQLLKNPVKLKKLRDMLKKQRNQNDETSNKKKKKKAKSKKRSSKSSCDDDDDDDDIDEQLKKRYKKLKTNLKLNDIYNLSDNAHDKSSDYTKQSYKTSKKSKKSKKAKYSSSSESSDDSEEDDSDSVKFKTNKKKFNDKLKHSNERSRHSFDKCKNVKKSKNYKNNVHSDHDRSDSEDNRKSKSFKRQNSYSGEGKSCKSKSKRLDSCRSDKSSKRNSKTKPSSSETDDPHSSSESAESPEPDDDSGKKKYGLVLPAGKDKDKHSYMKEKQNVKSDIKKGNDSDAKKSANTTEKTKYVRPKPLKLTEEEKEERRREMMKNAEWRNEFRDKNIKSYKEKEEKEKRQEKDYSSDFYRKQMSYAASQGTVEGRIKSNINRIQRSASDMDRNFARR